MCRIYGDNPTVEVSVLVYRRPHMRAPSLEYEMHMGTNVLRGLFDEMKEMPDVTSLFLSFPENWMNIVEQRSLFNRLEHFCPNLKQLTIKTQSVYIIQSTPAGMAKIVSSEEERNNPLPQEDSDSNNVFEKLYTPMVGNLFDASKLNVL